MRVAAADKILSVEEYIKSELSSETRHEYINGQLFEMPGEKDINNEIASFIITFLINYRSQFTVYSNSVKVAIPGGEKYYYPDVFTTKEPKTEHNRYIKYEPELIVEVLSPTTQITDRVDKYIDYTTIPSLKYYLIVEPEIVYITLYYRTEEGGWAAKVFSQKTEIIELPAWGISLPLEKIYRS